MKQTCYVCGKEDDEYFMDRLTTGGARTKWICTKCGYCLTSWESYPKCDCPRCGATEQKERSE